MMVLQFVIAINFKSFDYEIYMFEMSKLVKLMSKVNWNKILAYKNVSHSGWICYVNVLLVSYGGHNS